MTSTTTDIAGYPDRYFAAWNGRDVAVVESILTPELSWIDPLLPAELTDYDGARMFFQGGWQGFPDIAFEPIGEPLIDATGSRVAHEWRMTGTHLGEFPAGVAPTGNTFAVSGTDIWTIAEDGRATTVRAYYDSAALARQLELA